MRNIDKSLKPLGEYTHTHTHTYNSLVNGYNKNRIKSIDIAKAIGIFLIVLGHTLTFGNLRKFVYAFHVPLFFFLSGICFSKKDNITFLKKKIKSLYFPYIIMSIISILIYSFMGKYMDKGTSFNIWNNIFGMIYANPNLENMQWNQPLWFLPCLFMQLFIINILENIINNNKYKQIIRVLFVIALTILGYILSAMKIYLPLQLEAAMCMMIFTYLGILIKENKERLKASKLCKILTSKRYLYVVFLIVTIGLCSLLVYNNETISVMQDKYGNYVMYFVVSILMIINIMIISKIINKIWKKQNIISYIGQNTLIILLLHKFPILFFQYICPLIKNILNKSDTFFNSILAIILAIIVIVMCIICKYILDIIVRRINDDTNKA